MYKALAVVLVVVALALMVVPNFTDCQSQGGMITLANGNKISMKCHWTGRAEIAPGLGLLVIGSMMAFNRRRETLRNLSILGVVLGASAILLPTTSIGTCMTPTMVCNTAMKPAVLALGIVGIVASGAAFALAPKKES